MFLNFKVIIVIKAYKQNLEKSSKFIVSIIKIALDGFLCLQQMSIYIVYLYCDCDL